MGACCSAGPVKAPPSVSLATARASLRVAVIGSSVALGPREMGGWAQHLALALKARYGDANATAYGTRDAAPKALPYGCAVENFAESGGNSQAAVRQLRERVAVMQPHVLIIGLSLANQGLLLPNAKAADVTFSFEYDCQQMTAEATRWRPPLAVVTPAAIALATARGEPEPQAVAGPHSTVVMFGGLYPNDAYTADQYRELKAMEQKMRAWKGVHCVFDFLTATDDGQGHWAPELTADAAHPNGAGHRRMFERIGVAELFDPIAARIAAQYPPGTNPLGVAATAVPAAVAQSPAAPGVSAFATASESVADVKSAI